MQQVLDVMDAFGELDDPRSRLPAHFLIEMLVLALAAILSGADTWVAIEIWGRAQAGLAPAVFAAAQRYRVARHSAGSSPRWLRPSSKPALSAGSVAIFPTVAGHVVAIEGKTVRGSHQDGARAIHLVSAYSSQLNLVLGQVRTADHSNEITAVPVLLEALFQQGATVTLGAMGCQRAIAHTWSPAAPTTGG